MISHYFCALFVNTHSHFTSSAIRAFLCAGEPALSVTDAGAKLGKHTAVREISTTF